MNIMNQVQEKENVIQEKANQIIVLQNQVQQAQQQTQQYIVSLEAAKQEVQGQVQQIQQVAQQEQQKCQQLEQQVIVLNDQAELAGPLQILLAEEKQKYQELYMQLTNSEQQKAELLNKLDVVAVNQQQHPEQQCQPIIQIMKEAQQMQHIELEQFQQQLQQNNVQVINELKDTQVQLAVKEEQINTQRNELTNLQAQLMQVNVFMFCNQ